MGYRLRISDELYRLLRERALNAGVSIESLTERYILEAVQLNGQNVGSQTSLPWTQSQQPDEPNLRLVVS